MTHIGRLFGLAALVSLSTLSTPRRALAADFAFQFTNVFSGASPASSNAPWMSAVFQDLSPGKVRLTISNLGLTDSENVNEIWFNLDPNLNPRKLTFSFGNNSGGFDRPTVSTGANKFQVNGNGNYDIQLNFADAGTASDRFTAGEYLTCTISGIVSLKAADFRYLSTPAGNSGSAYAAALIDRIGCDLVTGGVSALAANPISPVPEPGSGLLLGLAAGLLLGGQLRKRCAKALAEARRQPAPVRARPRETPQAPVRRS